MKLHMILHFEICQLFYWDSNAQNWRLRRTLNLVSSTGGEERIEQSGRVATKVTESRHYSQRAGSYKLAAFEVKQRGRPWV